MKVLSAEEVLNVLYKAGVLAGRVLSVREVTENQHAKAHRAVEDV